MEVDKDRVLAARSLGAGQWKLLTYVLFWEVRREWLAYSSLMALLVFADFVCSDIV